MIYLMFRLEGNEVIKTIQIEDNYLIFASNRCCRFDTNQALKRLTRRHWFIRMIALIMIFDRCFCHNL